MTIAGSIICLLITLQLPNLGVSISSSSLVVAAVAICSGITYLGWYLHSRQSNKRIKILLDNVGRIRAGQSLNPQIAGKDMIARLDKAIFSVSTLFLEHRRSLESSDQKTRSLVETVTIGIIITDENGTVLGINPRTQTLLEMSSEQIVGKNIRTLISDLETELPFEPEKFKESVEFEYSIADDKRVFLEVSLNPFGKASDKTWLISLIDISERKQLEKLKQEFMQMIGLVPSLVEKFGDPLQD